jgi:basic membrane protein A
VCADEQVLDQSMAAVMGRLADKSLVVRVERGGRTWYRLLETIWEFAFQRMSSSLEAIQERGFLIHLAGRTDRSLLGSVETMWSTFLEGDAEVARNSLTAAANSFREDQGGELAGAIAAMVSKGGRIGFVAGFPAVDAPLYVDRLDAQAGVQSIMGRFRDGFAAGARRRNPAVEIVEAYLVPAMDFYTAFQNPGRAGEVAAEVFATGADVIFHAAGSSGSRIFEMARRVSEDTGVHRWVIGVDFDEYQDLEEHLHPHVLCSIRKQVPIAVFREIKRAVAENRLDEAPRFDLSNGGLALATTGGHVDHLAEELESIRAGIIERSANGG